MALGITVDFNANLGNIAGQVDAMAGHLNNFQRHAESMSSSVVKAFEFAGIGLGLHEIKEFVSSGIEAADAMYLMSQKTGIAVETLSGFQLATKQTGTDMDAFTLAANKLSKNIGNNSEEFAKLGITAKDPAEAFMQLADVMKGIDDPQQRAALGAKALGKAWAEMAPLLMLGGNGLRDVVAQGEKLSGITAENAKSAHEFNDEWEVMTAHVKRLSVEIAGPMVSAFNNLYESINNATERGVSFESVMKGLFNAFTHQDQLTGVAGDLQRINEQIDAAEKKMAELKAGTGAKFSMSDTKAPINVDAEQKKLDDLYKQQEDAYKKLQDLPKDKPDAKTSQQKIDEFIGHGPKTDANQAASDAKKLAAEGAKVFEQTRTPLEKYNEQLQKLSDLLQKGAISQNTYARATAAATEALAGNAAKTAELSDAQQSKMDSLQASLKTFKDQSALDAFNGKQDPYTQNRLQDIMREMAVQQGDANGAAPVNFDKAAGANDKLILPVDVDATKIMDQVKSVTEQVRDYLASNPLTIQFSTQNISDASIPTVDLSALAAGTL